MADLIPTFPHFFHTWEERYTWRHIRRIGTSGCGIPHIHGFFYY